MSKIKFPLDPESSHKHYLWNEQEYIMRMITQNALSIQIYEDSAYVYVSMDPENSNSYIAQGPVDFTRLIHTKSFRNDTSQWIYCRATDGMFETSQTVPVYDQYTHGWYN